MHVFSICFIIAFFYKKLSLKIHWKIFNLVITDCINMLGIWIYLARFLHLFKLLFIIKMSCYSFINISRFDFFSLLFNIILPPFIYIYSQNLSVFILAVNFQYDSILFSNTLWHCYNISQPSAFVTSKF